VNALTQRLVVAIILVMSHLLRARHVIRIAVQWTALLETGDYGVIAVSRAAGVKSTDTETVSHQFLVAQLIALEMTMNLECVTHNAVHTKVFRARGLYGHVARQTATTSTGTGCVEMIPHIQNSFLTRVLHGVMKISTKRSVTVGLTLSNARCACVVCSETPISPSTTTTTSTCQEVQNGPLSPTSLTLRAASRWKLTMSIQTSLTSSASP